MALEGRLADMVSLVSTLLQRLQSSLTRMSAL